jgi:hypothetical protein
MSTYLSARHYIHIRQCHSPCATHWSSLKPVHRALDRITVLSPPVSVVLTVGNS